MEVKPNFPGIPISLTIAVHQFNHHNLYRIVQESCLISKIKQPLFSNAPFSSIKSEEFFFPIELKRAFGLLFLSIGMDIIPLQKTLLLLVPTSVCLLVAVKQFLLNCQSNNVHLAVMSLGNPREHNLYRALFSTLHCGGVCIKQERSLEQSSQRKTMLIRQLINVIVLLSPLSCFFEDVFVSSHI